MTADPPRAKTPRAPAVGPRRRLRTNGVILDVDGQLVFSNGTEIALSRREFSLLFILLQNAGWVFSRRDPLDVVWHPGHPDERKILEVLIRGSAAN